MDAHHPVSRRDWQARELLWLDVDTLLRGRSGRRHSLDGVAHRLFGGDSGDDMIRIYRFDDLVAALNAFVQDGVDRVAVVYRPAAQTWPTLKPSGARPWLLDVLRAHATP